MTHTKLTTTQAKKILATSFLIILFCFTSCDQAPIFSAINKEIELEEAVITGNVFSMIEISGTLYTANGRIYSKNTSDIRGWTEHSKPSGRVTKVAKKDDNLYALVEETGNTTVYRHDKTSSPWTSTEEEFPATPLTKCTAEGNDYSASEKTIKKGTNVVYTANSTIHAIAYSDNTFYIATEIGLEQATLETDGTLSKVSISSQAESLLGSYPIHGVWIFGHGIYASSITKNSRNNGLWGYYTDRTSWNRE
ncbi:MAG TPA: hypothetical protein VFC68_06910 [Treponemataceae bacterium]|nr:hypothetical protein [Treponemataceae bacterium]